MNCHDLQYIWTRQRTQELGALRKFPLLKLRIPQEGGVHMDSSCEHSEFEGSTLSGWYRVLWTRHEANSKPSWNYTLKTSKSQYQEVSPSSHSADIAWMQHKAQTWCITFKDSFGRTMAVKQKEPQQQSMHSVHCLVEGVHWSVNLSDS